MRRFLFAAALLLAATIGVVAQTPSNVPNHALPVGKGQGVVGFGAAGPCAVGQSVLWATGPGADPTCGIAGVTSITAGTGITVSPSPITTEGSVSLIVPVSVANGGTSATTAPAAFSNIKQDATTIATGVAELATTTEVAAGTDTTRIVTAQGTSVAIGAHTMTVHFVRNRTLARWDCWSPDGTLVSIVGTTTDGLQECATYAANNNYNLHAHGGNPTWPESGDTNNTVTLVTSFSVPLLQNAYWIIEPTLSCATNLNTCVYLNSMLHSQIRFGRIIVRPNNGAGVVISPTTSSGIPNPLFHANKIYIQRIYMPAGVGSTQGLLISSGSGEVWQNDIQIMEIEGDTSGGVGYMSSGVQVQCSVGPRFVSNTVRARILQANNAAFEEGTSATHLHCLSNRLYLELESGLAGSVGLTTYATNDEAVVTVRGTALSTGLLLNTQSNGGNYVLVQSQGSPAVTNSGTSNTVYYNGGIYLGGTTTPLSYYGEGTWTPAIGGTTTPGTQTYAANGQTGRYIRIGNQITAWFVLSMTAKDAATSGNLRVAGLPFTSSTIAGFGYPCAIANQSNFDLDSAGGYYAITAQIGSNSTSALLYEVGDNVALANLTDVDLNATSLIVGACQYRMN